MLINCVFFFNLEFLRKVPARKLIDYSLKTLTPEDARRNVGLPFVPTIEFSAHDRNDWENSILNEHFMTDEPMNILRSKKINKIPYMTGFNSHEALLFMRSKFTIN